MPRAERREQLLRVARKIILRNGIGALTMSALAEESGASKPVVYEHFDNSESVAIALLDAYFATMIDLVDNRARHAETLDEYLSIAIDTQFEFHKKDKLVVRSITNGHSSGNRLNAAYLRLKENSVETLQELVRQQGAPEEATRTAGFLIWEMMSSGVYEFAGSPNAESAREALKRMVIGAVHAIAPTAGIRPVTPEKILETSRALKASGDT
jgi:AcrR family transcriptional regulator